MSILNKRAPFLLFLGDIIIFYISLFLTLLIRYKYVPTKELLTIHLVPFSILFITWILILFIGGLYEKRALVLKNKLPGTIFRIQITNSVVAVLFFYFIPIFGITPKTILFIYLFVSFALLMAWRVYGYSLFGSSHKQKAILIAKGQEMKELQDEVNASTHYNIDFVAAIDLNTIEKLDVHETVTKNIALHDVSMIAIDMKSEKVEPVLSELYNLIFSGIVFIDAQKIYEDVFDRIPLSLITYSWFIENISRAPKVTYDFLKRIMDICIALPLACVSLIFYPFIYMAMKFDEGQGFFSIQKRVGQNNNPIKLFKFRTMTVANDGGKWGDSNQNKVTRIGAFLRKTRLDELPQLWNVVFGDISLIGPRPEFQEAVSKYEQEIPYYGVRHLIKPGLSGWAQMYHDNHPHHGVAVDATKEKLSYDLFYLKNRSFLLDIKIALKTINILVSRKGL